MNARPAALLALSALLTIALTQPATAAESSTSEDSAQGQTLGITHGPFVGHVGSTTASVWARCEQLGPHACVLTNLMTGAKSTASARVAKENDRCVVWKFDQLQPNQTYQYSIGHGRAVLCYGDAYRLKTAPGAKQPAKVAIGFGSCAREDKGTASTWVRVEQLKPAAFVLLGDTPYIDTTDLAQQRKRYNQFAAVPAMAKLFRSTSMYATWDDHDFGRNDTDGRLPGKERSRQAFIEHRANASYGNGREGIYTSFRRGGVEVFLLDARTFADYSAKDPNEHRLLGDDQWQWLEESLRKSSAPFKVLATGMIWNGAVRPGKRDHWGNYPRERDKLFRFLGQHSIGGVVLVGGDVHRSRVVRHATTDSVGYPLTEFITSPMHNGIIAAANAAHPGLQFDVGEPYSFLLITADTTATSAKLTCQIHNASGDVLYEQVLTAEELREP